MALLGDELVVSSPLGEDQRAFGCGRSSQEERDQQRTDFGNRQGDQVGDSFFRRDRLRASARITTSIAKASIDSVMCRYQPIQERTSYSLRPVRCLACSKHSSMVQRRPAIEASLSNAVPFGA
jgi:hypothetical protein